MRRTAAWRALAGAALAFGLVLPGPARAQPPVWIVRHGAATLVLFGSIHLLPSGLDWRPPALDDALARADQLWFELPIGPQTDYEAEVAIEQHGLLPPKGSLLTLIGPDRAAKLTRAAGDLHLLPAALDHMRPWLAEVTLSVAEDAQSGANASNGVERVVDRAAPASVRRMAFESVDQQIGFLAGAKTADQVASLDETLHEIDDTPDAYQKVVADWMAGDVAALQADALDPLRKASPGLYGRLITGRNRRWVARLAQRLSEPGVTVVVVGVGHLIGPDGLPAQLRAKGFEVEGP